MTASGHEEQFVRRRLSDRFRFNQVTFAEAVASWNDPPRAITFGLSDSKGKQRHRKVSPWLWSALSALSDTAPATAIRCDLNGRQTTFSCRARVDADLAARLPPRPLAGGWHE